MDFDQSMLVADGDLVGFKCLLLDPPEGAADQLVKLLFDLDWIAPDVGVAATIVPCPAPHAIIHPLMQVLAERHVDRISLAVDGPQPRLSDVLLLVFIELMAECHPRGDEPT